MLISIITPSYNQLDWLRLCVSSIRDQLVSTPPTLDSGLSTLSIEHIIQDAGTPGIQELANEFGAEFFRDGNLQNSKSTEDSRKSYTLKVYSEQDGGMYDAVNRGFKRCSGDIVCYLNCDEQLLEGAVQNVYDFFRKNPNCEILSAGCLIVNSQGDLETIRPGLVPSLGHILTDHLPTLTASLFYRKEVIKNKWNLFDSRYKDLADMLWMIDRLAEKRLFKRASFYTSAFADTGQNMNLMPNARAEANYLQSKIPPYLKRLKFFYVIRHRLTKFLAGCYAPCTIKYSIYTKSSPNARAKFERHGRFGVWRSRLS
jgi:glycosyltransferase involved in cell wall biosynthesis